MGSILVACGGRAELAAAYRLFDNSAYRRCWCVRSIRRRERGPVEWLLWTSLPVDAIDAVRQVVPYYCVQRAFVLHDDKGLTRLNALEKRLGVALDVLYADGAHTIILGG